MKIKITKQNEIENFQKGGSAGEMGSSIPEEFFLQDPRNSVNAGGRRLIEIQTEKGEFISSPLGDIVKVAAKKKHKHQDDDHVSDVTAEGNYVHSNDKKSMTITKDKGVGKIKNVRFDYIIMGKDYVYYEEGKLNKEPKEYTLADIEPNKKKYTHAELVDNLAKKFPVTTREKDPFAMRAQVENKQSRVPYLDKIVELSEMRKTKRSPSKYKTGGFTNIASIYQPMIDAKMNQLSDNAITGTYFPEDPLMDRLVKLDNSLKYNRDVTKMPTTMKNSIMKFPGGGYPQYEDEDPTLSKTNKREQWNYWLEQGQDRINDFAYNNTIPSLQGQAGIQALGVLGQNAYQGHNEYLYGNQYRSQLDNLKNSQDRSFGSEEAYATSLVDQANSVARLGVDPSMAAGMRSDAIRQSNGMINNLGQQRRSMTDRYGTLNLNATDMFAGRQNQQRAYLNDFDNNRTQNLAGIGSGLLSNINQAEGSALSSNLGLQMAKQPGTGWSDFTNGLGDAINAITGLIGAFTGAGGGGGNQGGQQQPNGTWSGYAPFGGGSGPSFGLPSWQTPTIGGFGQPLNANANYGSNNYWNSSPFYPQ
jgi:hypothetical protein